MHTKLVVELKFQSKLPDSSTCSLCCISVDFYINSVDLEKKKKPVNIDNITWARNERTRITGQEFNAEKDRNCRLSGNIIISRSSIYLQ